MECHEVLYYVYTLYKILTRVNISTLSNIYQFPMKKTFKVLLPFCLFLEFELRALWC
jgi:hypothetical protein